MNISCIRPFCHRDTIKLFSFLFFKDHTVKMVTFNELLRFSSVFVSSLSLLLYIFYIYGTESFFFSFRSHFTFISLLYTTSKKCFVVNVIWTNEDTKCKREKKKKKTNCRFETGTASSRNHVFIFLLYQTVMKVVNRYCSR